MQSLLQYRRFGKALEAQLGRSKNKVSQSRQQRRDEIEGEDIPTTEEKDLEQGLHNNEDAVAHVHDPELRAHDGPDIITPDSIDASPSQSGHESTGDGRITRDETERTVIPEDEDLNDLRVVPTHRTTGTTLGRAITGIEIRPRTTREGGPELGNVFVVSWESEKDPINPYNWALSRRIICTFTISLISSVVGFASAIDSTIIPQAAAEFGVGEIIEALASGLFLIGFGAGALVAGPFSETLGRNPVYITTIALYMLFLVGAGASPNIGSQLVCRFFAGMFGATPLVCAGGSLSDIWTPQERVFAFPLFACSSFLGPLLAPIVGDWIGQSSTLSWRWTEWVTLIASGVILTIVVLTQPETYAPVLLGWKAKQLRQITGDKRYRGAIELRKTPLIVRLRRVLYRPFLMFIQEPILILFGLYLTMVYIVLFTFLTGYTYIFTGIYGLSTGMTRVCFVGQMVGILSCSLLIPLNMHLRKRDIARAKAIGPNVKVAPESRLYWAMIGGPAVPISLFWMGWTAHPNISIWSPLLASVLFGFGIICVFITTYQYLMDTYEIYAASALASVTFLRYTISGAFIEISIPFYENMGVACTLTILGSLSGVLVAIPYMFCQYGPAIRKRSRFVPEVF
ncbi:hypothetical protein TMatcc_005463 [Talaromyces marneffei ATCC 18224]|nr:hypothetical protein EYB25_003521 [Talaromyces marneffei]